MRRGRPGGPLPAARCSLLAARCSLPATRRPLRATQPDATHAAGSAWRLHARLCRPADRRGLDRYVSMDGCAPR
ncbi:hypothetical protein C6Q08_09530 [Burkholderia multivorans]|uniref:Uncharacterized protein n=1 Tax=Burkholderia multivorans TaxID=87883 RepID=A0A8E2S377_9BURK|nr:hypothetical protein C6P98_02850 [Burkholderia multivorans]PRF35009.1 hypothetical protein C6Q08_09530 [Burkholderia multivorans]